MTAVTVIGIDKLNATLKALERDTGRHSKSAYIAGGKLVEGEAKRSIQERSPGKAVTLACPIVINYDSGYATSNDIPPNALTGIQLLTAYLFDHRGACDVSTAAQQSGAKTMWASDVMILTL